MSPSSASCCRRLGEGRRVERRAGQQAGHHAQRLDVAPPQRRQRLGECVRHRGDGLVQPVPGRCLVAVLQQRHGPLDLGQHPVRRDRRRLVRPLAERLQVAGAGVQLVDQLPHPQRVERGGDDHVSGAPVQRRLVVVVQQRDRAAAVGHQPGRVADRRGGQRPQAEHDREQRRRLELGGPVGQRVQVAGEQARATGRVGTGDRVHGGRGVQDHGDLGPAAGLRRGPGSGERRQRRRVLLALHGLEERVRRQVGSPSRHIHPRPMPACHVFPSAVRRAALTRYDPRHRRPCHTGGPEGGGARRW